MGLRVFKNRLPLNTKTGGVILFKMGFKKWDYNYT